MFQEHLDTVGIVDKAALQAIQDIAELVPVDTQAIPERLEQAAFQAHVGCRDIVDIPELQDIQGIAERQGQAERQDIVDILELQEQVVQADSMVIYIQQHRVLMSPLEREQRRLPLTQVLHTLLDKQLSSHTMLTTTWKELSPATILEQDN